MNARSFDALTKVVYSTWSRRDFGQWAASAILGAVATGIALAQAADSCRAIGKRCDRAKQCCSHTCKKGACRCGREGTRCTSYETCCSRTCDFLVGGGTCAPCRGRGCDADRPCCGGLACINGYCDGCRDRGTSCSSNSQCCFSDCVSGACLSAAGGRCARDADCRACYLNHDCDGACVDGVCTH
jgi:hypothetical protein